MNEWRRGDLAISTDPSRLDRSLIVRFLAGSYWAKGIPQGVVDRSIEGSLCFGLYRGQKQLGFARVITDYATFAYLGDVFVVETSRGKGLGVWMMEVIMSHPRLQNLRRWMLATRDAHGLYEKFGWRSLENPERMMEIVDPEIYLKKSR
jgi:GNAT superfamily N-acetyltransferase